MIQSEQVENRRVEVVDRDDIVHGLVAEFVRGSVRKGGFDASTGEPAGKAFGIVVATAGPFLEGRHATEFGTPDDQRVFEQAALFQVFDESCGRLIEDRTVDAVLILDLFVSVPVADPFPARLVGTVEELNEADAFLDQAAGEETVFRVSRFELVFAVINTVHMQRAG